MTRRILAVLLALAMVMSLCAVDVFAAEPLANPLASGFKVEYKYEADTVFTNTGYQPVVTDSAEVAKVLEAIDVALADETGLAVLQVITDGDQSNSGWIGLRDTGYTMHQSTTYSGGLCTVRREGEYNVYTLDQAALKALLEDVGSATVKDVYMADGGATKEVTKVVGLYVIVPDIAENAIVAYETSDVTTDFTDTEALIEALNHPGAVILYTATVSDGYKKCAIKINGTSADLWTGWKSGTHSGLIVVSDYGSEVTSVALDAQDDTITITSLKVLAPCWHPDDEFVYTANDDGTHTVACGKCDEVMEKAEDCTPNGDDPTYKYVDEDTHSVTEICELCEGEIITTAKHTEKSATSTEVKDDHTITTTTVTCDDCEEELSSETDEADHKEVVGEPVDNKDGTHSTTTTCEVEGCEYEKVESEAHKYVDGKCEVCDAECDHKNTTETKTTEKNADGHTITTTTVTCDDCEEELSSETDEADHKEVVGEPVDNGDGTHSTTTTCEVEGCEYEKVESEAHKYVDGKCECGAEESQTDPDPEPEPDTDDLEVIWSVTGSDSGAGGQYVIIAVAPETSDLLEKLAVEGAVFIVHTDLTTGQIADSGTIRIVSYKSGNSSSIKFEDQSAFTVTTTDKGTDIAVSAAALLDVINAASGDELTKMVLYINQSRVLVDSYTVTGAEVLAPKTDEPCEHENTTETKTTEKNADGHTITTTTVTCDDCEEELSSETDEADHKEVVGEPVDNKDGTHSTTTTCEVEGCEYEKVESEAHKYVDGKCECGAEESQTDPEVPCEHEHTSAVPNEDGKTHNVVCGDCGVTVKENVEHTYVDGKCECGAEESQTNPDPTPDPDPVPQPPVSSSYPHAYILDLGPLYHGILIADGRLIPELHTFNALGICNMCGHVRDTAAAEPAPEDPEEIVVETPTQGTDNDEDPTEDGDSFNVEDNAPDSNPKTGLALAVVPMLVAAAAAVASRKQH